MSSTKSPSDALATAAALPDRLATALGAPDIRRSGSRFAHELSYGRHFGPAPATARQAAVIVLLFRRNGRWHIPLTVRPEILSRHGGQISLPGGTIESGESGPVAAERELREELGTDVPVRHLGRLADCYVFASDFLITPWVAAASQDNPVWNPHSNEVARVIELPLEALFDARNEATMTIERGPVVFRAGCYRFDNHDIWGATSVILAELAAVLCQIAES
jgi:8-oxo-dGTP pyrophosphatase MutT (NUDIX family)